MAGIAGEVANLIVALKLDDSGFSGKLNNASKTLRGLDSSLSRTGRGLGQMGTGLARIGERAAILAAGGLAAVVTTAASFEQAFTGVEKTVDGTDRQLAELEGTLREMARTIPVSFEELAAIGEAGGALGIARDDLDEFIDVVARLGVSTDLSSDQAATALGQLGNVLHLTGDDFEEFADSLVALGNAGASTESQIVEIAARFAAAGNSAGLTKEEILALSSAVASMGIEVEAGGSALSRIFNNVATGIGTNAKEAKAFARTLGLSAAEFREAWERDALGTFQDFLGELGKLDQFEQARVLEKVGITNVRDINAVRLMTQNVGFLNDQLDISRDAQGSLREESDKFFGTAQNQWKTFVNIVRDGAAIIGTEVLPVTQEVMKELGDRLKDPEVQRSLKAFGEDLAEGIRDFVTEIKSADFSGLVDLLKTSAGFAKTALDLFNALPGPVKGALITGIALNRVTGGGLGLLLRGAGNVAVGSGGLAARLFGGLRGQSPVAPMYVAVVGPGGALGVGGAAAGRGLAGALGTALKGVFTGGLAAFIGIEIGKAIGQPIYDAAVKPAEEFYEGQLAGGTSPSVIQKNIEALTRQINDFESRAPQVRQMWQPLIDRLKADRTVLQSQLDDLFGPSGQFNPRNPGGTPGTTLREQVFGGKVDDIPRVREEIAALRHDNREYDGANQRRFGSLEQRLIRDKSFAQELTPERFLKLLARTSEFGEKGKGTSIEFGPTTGRDPTGRAFLALINRIPEEHLKDRRVIGELERHIVAAEEVQAQAIKDGDIEQAKKLQRTIDGIHALLGSVDETKPLLRDNERAQKDTARRIQDTRAAIMEQKLALDRGLGAANARLERIANKDTSLNLNLTIPVASYVSVNEVIRQSVVVGTIRNNIPVGPGL